MLASVECIMTPWRNGKGIGPMIYGIMSLIPGAGLVMCKSLGQALDSTLLSLPNHDGYLAERKWNSVIGYTLLKSVCILPHLER